MSYDRPAESAEYGGGGRGPDNYYNANNELNDGTNRAYGRQHSLGGGGNDINDSYGGEGNYGADSGGYENNDWRGAQQHAERHAGDSGTSCMYYLALEPSLQESFTDSPTLGSYF